MEPVEIFKLPKLYGSSKDGKTKEWEIRVEQYELYSEIVSLHGYTNKTETRRRIDKGKNIGKSNATTHFSQAKLEAQSKWKKKNEIEMYSEKIPSTNKIGKSEIEQMKTDTPCPSSMNVPKLPMLAQEFNKHKSKIKYPCFVQPKLDGYRMIYDSTKRTFTTRQGKDFIAIKDASKLYHNLCLIPEGFILDGELYAHGQKFESLGVLRKIKLTDKDKQSLEKLEYHVYDLISDEVFSDRIKRLNFLHSSLASCDKIELVSSYRVESEKEIQEMHQFNIKHGYEGTMVRNANSKYLQKNRSYDLLKLKDFTDEEFEIVDYAFEKDTTGEDKNCVVWVVKVKEGVLCNVRPRGERQQRQKLYEECVNNFEKYKGRKLWTKFFDYTADGSLRFPTTKTEDVSTYIRDEII